MTSMERYFVYPDQVDNFGFDWGRLALTVGPDVNGAGKFSAGVVFVPPGQGHDRHNHPGAEEIIFIISGTGKQMLEDEDGTPHTRSVGPGCSVFIPESRYHSTLNTGDVPMQIFVVYSPAGPELALRELPDFHIIPAASLTGQHSMTGLPARSAGDLDYRFAHLDDLMEAAGIDILLATSKHNVRYLLGGYQFIFFDAMDAIGHSRYLPIFVYFRGDPDKTAYVANKMEAGEHQNHPFWVPHFFPVAWGSVDSVQAALDHIRQTGIASARIGVEPAFLPSDTAAVITGHVPNAELRDATGVLERLRAVKSPRELALLRQASEAITDAMLATISGAGAGHSKTRIIESLRLEETRLGLTFDYCLLTLGDSHNRAAGDQQWADGELLSIDSGGNLHGYIGDICRMGFLGEPDSQLHDLLGEVEAVQLAAFSKIRAGTSGGDMIAHAETVLAQQPSRDCTDFFGHGMGLISHEAPFLMTNHPVTYEGIDADRPLEAGMVVSIETTMTHPTRGFIKLEDTLHVTEDGYELFGERGRGWNIGGTAR